MAGIRLRAALIALVPMIGFFLVSFSNLADHYAISGAMQQVEAQARLVTQVSALVHELQKERGASALHLGSGGKEFGAELTNQRRLTDQRATELRQGVTAAGTAAAGDMTDLATLAGMADLRNGVSSQSLKVAQAFGAYTKLISGLLSAADGMAKTTGSDAVAALLIPYVDFLQGKERAGQERALGSALFSSATYTPELHRTYLSVVAQQELFFERFRAHAVAESVAAFDRAMRSDAARGALELRGILVDLAATRDFKGTPARTWFAASTARIDQMKTVEDAMADGIAAAAATTGQAAWTDLLAEAAFIGGLLLVTVLVSGVIIRSITGPLSCLAVVTGRLAAGHVDEQVPSTGRADEIGAVARAVAVFKEHQLEMLQLREAQSRQREDAEADRHRRMLDLAAGLESKVQSVVQQVCAGADHIITTAEHMGAKINTASSRSLNMADLAARTATSAESVSTAAAELSRSIAEINRKVASSTTIADRAVTEAGRVDGQVMSLSRSVQSIGDVVHLISDIAAQTNLLALNATIEAARAGESGKGFAVVANEVKALASQTARATDEISSQIATIQAATGETVQGIRAISRIIGEISEMVANIAGDVRQQGVATEHIAHHVESVSSDAQGVQQDIQDVTASSASSFGSAIQVLWAADDLADPAHRLGREMEDFLRTVRAG